MRNTRFAAIVVVLLIMTLAAVAFAEAQYPRHYRGARPKRGANRRGGSEWLARELGLTEKEKPVVMLQVRKLISLKRRAIPGLRRLKALQQDKNASAEEIAAGLKRFRNNLADARVKIIREEKKLVEMKEITPRRELTLTLLGILDNGRSSPKIPNIRVRTRRRKP